ncbi:MAG: M48 family metallopeptidase [Clostridia bacterium]|jgi:predicted metal-dependent hydrolase|nr:M48 family metallopeptidase [Clostridia bacterium]
MKEEIQYEITYSKIKNVYIQIKEGKIIIKAPKRISKKELEKIIENKSEWIKSSLEKSKQKQEKSEKYTKEQFKEIVEKQANELIKETGLVPNKIRIKDIKYAWGTCSANKNITINYKLIKYSEQAIKYVILHELCHLKYMNHSKEFWGLVERYMQNYKEIKREFKE